MPITELLERNAELYGNDIARGGKQLYCHSSRNGHLLSLVGGNAAVKGPAAAFDLENVIFECD